MTEAKAIGPTGRFPLGKLTADDEGELVISIGVERDEVHLRFGAPIAMLGMTPVEAVKIAQGLIKHARMIARRTGAVLSVEL